MYPLGARRFICTIITAYSPVYLTNRLWFCNVHIPRWRNWALVVTWARGCKFWNPVSLPWLHWRWWELCVRVCVCVCVCVFVCVLCALSPIWLFATPWTVALQAPLSMELFQARILEWVAISDSGDLPDSEIEPTSQSTSSPLHHLGSTRWLIR